MIDNYKGGIVKGSGELQTSIAGQEILPSGFDFVNLTILALAECTISVNGGDYIYIPANQTILLTVCSSLKIQENNIPFSWIGTVG